MKTRNIKHCTVYNNHKLEGGRKHNVTVPPGLQFVQDCAQILLCAALTTNSKLQCHVVDNEGKKCFSIPECVLISKFENITPQIKLL
jgi:hypothetical protein